MNTCAINWRPAMPKNPPQRQSFTKAVWFFLGLQGGRWTSAEIIRALRFPGWKDKAQSAHINNMAAVRLLARYRDEDGRTLYGVTRACKIPRDLTLAEIEQLAGIRFVEEACEPATTA